MLNIFKAGEENIQEHINDIYTITKSAFALYKDNLHAEISLGALSETKEDILKDIRQNTVYIAEKNGKILGSLRISRLSSDVAYLYRFAVDTDERNKGVGAELLSYAVEECKKDGYSVIALHTNSKYYKLARYYYGMNFYVHSTDSSRGYIRALFLKELTDKPVDISCAFKK
ncbi:MAG: GNAT family N-acetyltransferase [Clostridiales bacterium]|jgi:predicted N-acetyltransferase YhbS|nr:GNAT family N-acetyltransferase [Clostridiales bacterium]